MTDEQKVLKEDKKRPENEAAPEENLGDPVLSDEVGKSKDELSDKLDSPGGLEVEEMTESMELQKRREQTKDRLKELSELDTSTDESTEPFGDDEEGGFGALLREANLSPKHLKFCCGGVFLILALVMAVWGGILIFNSDNDSTDKKDKTDTQEEKDSKNDKDSGSEIIIGGDEDVSLISGLMVGADELVEDIGTDMGEDIGTDVTLLENYPQMIRDFTEIYNSLQVDVVELLDQSHDRSATLDEYLDELNYNQYLARQNIETLQAQISNLADEIQSTEKKRDEKENEFFTSLGDLDAYKSNAALDDYIEYAQEAVDLRARYQAREKLLSYYDQIADDIEARIRGVELNREALIKGIRVVDISGSNIDLIIGEDEF
ncbi:hypothetical protein KKC94_00125 [Patescibacteria group bacterium]|nr:hypothetical protein [Patescibacteria group bacterium]